MQEDEQKNEQKDEQENKLIKILFSSTMLFFLFAITFLSILNAIDNMKVEGTKEKQLPIGQLCKTDFGLNDFKYETNIKIILIIIFIIALLFFLISSISLIMFLTNKNEGITKTIKKEERNNYLKLFCMYIILFFIISFVATMQMEGILTNALYKTVECYSFLQIGSTIQCSFEIDNGEVYVICIEKVLQGDVNEL